MTINRQTEKLVDSVGEKIFDTVGETLRDSEDLANKYAKELVIDMLGMHPTPRKKDNPRL
jgi:hypothetical protein